VFEAMDRRLPVLIPPPVKGIDSMRRSVLASLALVLIPLAACGAPGDEEAPEAEEQAAQGAEDTEADEAPTSEEEAIATLEGFVDAINDHDGSAACELLTEDLQQELAQARGDAGGCVEAFEVQLQQADPEEYEILSEAVDSLEVTDVELGEEQTRASLTVSYTWGDEELTENYELEQVGDTWLLSNV
jgi:predicted small lipoprotein YifL